MRHRDYNQLREREHHPRVSIGLFFVLLGVALLVATNDLLNLGSMHRYFTWETALLFIGLLLLLNLHFTGGIILLSIGVWFLQDSFYFIPDAIFRNYYWPGVIVIIGIGFILSSLIRRNRNK